MNDTSTGFLVLHADEHDGERPLLYRNFIVSPHEADAKPRFALSACGVGFLPTGDIQAVKAKPKSGKTLFMAVLAASALGCTDFGMKAAWERMRVLYLDTEQNERNTAMFLTRVASLLKNDTPILDGRLTAISMRRLTDTAAKFDVMLSAIAGIKPHITIVDGIADLTQDFNDIGQSNELISKMMRISQAYDTAIANVLHTNKAIDDHNMKGHLGSLLLQKASDVFEVRRYNGGDFTAFHTDSRNAQVPPISFHVSRGPDNTDLRITPRETPKRKTTEEYSAAKPPNPKIGNTFRDIFKKEGKGKLQHTELTKAYMEMEHVTDRTAKSYIRKALDTHILSKDNGLYYMTENGQRQDQNAQ